MSQMRILINKGPEAAARVCAELVRQGICFECTQVTSTDFEIRFSGGF